MRRTLATVAIALVTIVATASPAAAHSVSGVTSTNYRTRLLSVRPQVPGVEIKVIEAGSRLELSNSTPTEVVVHGYQGEPYLRVGPNGVFENTESPATYLNASRKGPVAPPADADPTAKPVWRKTSSGQVARWHDHRTHFMGSRDPAEVRRNPDRQFVVNPNWTVDLDHGSRRIVAAGDLTWVPGPNPFPWVLLAVGFAAIAIVVALTRWWAVGLALLMALLVVVDIGHSLGIAVATGGGTGTKVAKFLLAGFYSVLAWVAGGVAVVALLRRRAEGLFAAAFASLVIMLFGGLSDVSALYRSQLPFEWNTDLARFAVAASLGLGTGIAIASVIGIRKHLPLTVAPPSASGAPVVDVATE